MCGRFLPVDDYDVIKSYVNVISKKFNEVDLPKNEAFPTNNIPVVYAHNQRLVLSTAKWGFPGFKNSSVIINARAETVAEKTMFRKLFASKRCLIPAAGYFEWLKNEDKTKTKYLIRMKEKDYFYMAGLYNIFKDKSGLPYAAISIITTRANTEIAFIHDRMPAIIDDESLSIWLYNTMFDKEILQGLLCPYSEGNVSYEIAKMKLN